MSAKPVRALLVGAGLMGRWHADAIRRAGSTLSGVCDLDLERARRLAAGAAVAADLHLLLGELAPDVVHVCAPLVTHRLLVEAALAAGAHVVVEKPLAASLADAEAVLAVAARLGRIVCPVHQLVFQRWVAGAGASGEPLEIAFSTCSAGAAGGGEEDAERVVEEILPHPLALFERLRPGSLEAARFAVLRPRPGELYAQAEVSGVALRIAISMGGRPTRNELRLTGRDGTLHADLFHGHAVFEAAHASRAYKIARPFALAGRQIAAAGWNLGRRALTGQAAYPGLRELVAAVHAQVRGEAGAALAVAEVLRVERARAAIASEGRPAPG